MKIRLISICLFCFLINLKAQSVKRLYIANDDHTDYMWTANEAKYDSAFVQMLDFYLHQIDSTKNNPPDFQARFNCDGSYWLRAYEKYRSAGQFQRLMTAVQSGHISSPLNTLVSCYGAQPTEAVLRGMYYAGRLERTHKVRFSLAQTMENNTIPLGLSALWAGSGAKYSYKGIGGYGSQMTYSYRQNRRNQLYKYAGLDGSSVLMKWYDYNGGPNGHTPIGGYAECRLVIKTVNPTKEIGTIINALDTFCDTISPKSKYPFNIAAAFGWGHDDLATFISNPFIDAAKNGTTEKRTVRVSNEVDFFEDVAKTYPNLPFETVSYGNEWDVYCASMNETTAKVRRSLEKLRSAEALAAIVGLKKPDFATHLTTSRNLAWESFGLYWEHNWTADGPVKRSIRADWENKLQRQITSYIDTLFTLSKDLLSQQIKKSDNANPRFYVFNPLSWVRDDVADFLFEDNYSVKVVDISTRQEVDNQLIIKNGRRYIRIFAEGIPSVGYKIFEIQRINSTPKTATAVSASGFIQKDSATQNGVRVSGDVLSNAFYQIRLSSSGVITELYDKLAKKNVVKAFDGKYLNDLGAKNTADGDPLSIENAGAVSVTLKAVSKTPILHTVRVTLFTKSPRIEIEDSIQANFKDVKTWAFSFNLDKPTTRHEELGAILTVKKEKNGGHYADQNARYDWQTFNHFADISEPNYGVTLSNQDCSFFKLGNSKVDSLDETAAQIQALAGGQVDKKVEDGGMMGIFNQNGDTAFCYKFALSTHQTAFNSTKALKFALTHQNPFTTGRVEGDKSADNQNTFSFLNISDPSVLLWSLKPAEDAGGLITRFWHTNAAPTTALLTLNRPLSKAWQTTHIETPIQVLSPIKNTLKTEFKQHQLKTYYLILK